MRSKNEQLTILTEQKRLVLEYKSQLENLPDIIYRYRPYNKKSIDALKNNQIYLTKAKCFNDPYDCSVVLKCLKEAEKMDILLPNMPKKDSSEAQNSIQEKYTQELQTIFDGLVADFNTKK